MQANPKQVLVKQCKGTPTQFGSHIDDDSDSDSDSDGDGLVLIIIGCCPVIVTIPSAVRPHSIYKRVSWGLELRW